MGSDKGQPHEGSEHNREIPLGRRVEHLGTLQGTKLQHPSLNPKTPAQQVEEIAE
jgi:hypothetical protein